MNIYLASGSPRRTQILKDIGVDHSVILPKVSEQLEPGVYMPYQTVQILSSRKAQAGVRMLGEDLRDGIVIAADTVVALDGKILGKPRDKEDALCMLKQLSGKKHTVYTGVCVASSADTVGFVSESNVFFKHLREDEIIRYIKTGEPMDKAGAYGIQGRGSVFLERIEGDYFGVVGLPVYGLCRVLENNFNLSI